MYLLLINFALMSKCILNTARGLLLLLFVLHPNLINAQTHQLKFPGEVIMSRPVERFPVNCGAYPSHPWCRNGLRGIAPESYSVVVRFHSLDHKSVAEVIIESAALYEPGTRVNVYFEPNGDRWFEKQPDDPVATNNADTVSNAIDQQPVDSKNVVVDAQESHDYETGLKGNTVAKENSIAIRNDKSAVDSKEPVGQGKSASQPDKAVKKSVETRKLDYSHTSIDAWRSSILFIALPVILVIALAALILSVFYAPALFVVGFVIELLSRPLKGIGNAAKAGLATALVFPFLIIALTANFLDQDIYRPLAERTDDSDGFLCCIPSKTETDRLDPPLLPSGYLLSSDGRYLIGFGTRNLKGDLNHESIPWFSIISIDEKAFVTLAGNRIYRSDTPLLAKYVDYAHNIKYDNNNSLWMTLQDISGTKRFPYRIDLSDAGIILGGVSDRHRDYSSSNAIQASSYRSLLTGVRTSVDDPNPRLETGYETDSSNWPEPPIKRPVKNIFRGNGRYSMVLQMEKRECIFNLCEGYHAEVNMVDTAVGNKTIKSYSLKFVDEYSKIISSEDSRVWVIISAGRVKMIDLRKL